MTLKQKSNHGHPIIVFDFKDKSGVYSYDRKNENGRPGVPGFRPKTMDRTNCMDDAHPELLITGAVRNVATVFMIKQ